jgi:hypothetical protein
MPQNDKNAMHEKKNQKKDKISDRLYTAITPINFLILVSKDLCSIIGDKDPLCQSQIHLSRLPLNI